MTKLGKSLAASVSIALSMWSTSPVTAGFGQPGHQVSGGNHPLPSTYQVARIELPERYQGTIEYAFGAGATRAVTKPLTGASGAMSCYRCSLSSVLCSCGFQKSSQSSKQARL